MAKVSDVLADKGSVGHTIEPTASVLEAVQKMVAEGVGSLIVARAEKICGIFTERDYLRRIVLKGRTSKTTTVEEVMTPKLICVDPDKTIEQCMAVMTAGRIRHLPVIREGKLAGVVSIGDLVKHATKRQKYEIQYLTDYISGKYPG